MVGCGANMDGASSDDVEPSRFLRVRGPKPALGGSKATMMARARATLDARALLDGAEPGSERAAKPPTVGILRRHRR